MRALASLALLLVPASLAAQVESAEPHLVSAATEAMRPVIAHYRGWEVTFIVDEDGGMTAQVARRMSARTHSHREAIRCEGPGRCYLADGLRAAITLVNVYERGAEVVVTYTLHGAIRDRPVFMRAERIVVAPGARGSWRIVRREEVWES